MFWLLRKLLVPVAAFAFGWAVHWQQSVEACEEAGGRYAARLCVGDGE